jgi:hypothetical protein
MGCSMSRSTTALVHGATSNTSASHVSPPTAVSERSSIHVYHARYSRPPVHSTWIQIRESPTFAEQFQQTQAQLAALIIAIADGNSGKDGITPSSPSPSPSAVVDGPATAHGKSRNVNTTTTDGPLPSESTATPSRE